MNDADALSMCIPALAIAVSESYDTPCPSADVPPRAGCPGHFDAMVSPGYPTSEYTDRSQWMAGLWQIVNPLICPDTCPYVSQGKCVDYQGSGLGCADGYDFFSAPVDFSNFTAEAQARAIYKYLTSDDPNYGCLAPWAVDPPGTYATVIPDIGQDPSTVVHHRFCAGAWTAGDYGTEIAAIFDGIGDTSRAAMACDSAYATWSSGR